MRFILKGLTTIFICVAMFGCSSIKPKSTPTQTTGVVNENQNVYVETGKASFYANLHQSRKTANGEIYDHKLLTAAHRTLPFGTKVRVTNISNGKTIVVKINDRGPFIRGRIIDLSRSAFSSIASTSVGVIQVKIEVIQ